MSKELIQDTANSAGKEAGIYIVLGTAVIVVFILFMGLVVGLGFISLANSRLQDSANLVAQSALKAYAESDASTHENKIATAIAKANQVFAANPLPGFQQSFGDIKLAGQGGTGGQIEAGHWYRGTPVWGGNPCQTAGKPYPCFVPFSGAITPGRQPNAVRAKIQNDPSTNPLVYPFKGFLGTASEQYNATAIASLIDRCFVFLIDVSPSTYYQTHPRESYAIIAPTPSWDAWQSVSKCSDNADSFSFASPGAVDCIWNSDTTDCIYNCAVKPDFTPVGAGTPLPAPGGGVNYTAVDLSMPFFRESATNAQGTPVFVVPAPNQSADTWCISDQIYKTTETYYWCNMRAHRTPSAAVDPREHFRSDFKRIELKNKETLEYFYIWADALKESGIYEGPEPYTTFLKAFNAGTKALLQAKSNNDKGMLAGFTGKIMGQYPEAKKTPPYDSLSGDLETLLQITNPDNFGKIDKNGDEVSPEVRPNAADVGLISVYYGAGTAQNSTNAILAINKAIDVLQRECPADTSRRVIVLASDGVQNCYIDGVMGFTGPTPTPLPAGTAQPTPEPTSSGASSTVEGDYDCGGYEAYTYAEQQLADLSSEESVVSRLKANNIALVTILSGDYIFPHFVNRWYHGENEEHPMDLKEAYARGYGGYGSGAGKTLFDDRAFFLSPGGVASLDGSDQRIFVEGEEAFNKLGSEGYYFPAPLAAFSDASLLTNGSFCPLMPLCGSACNSDCNNPGCEYEKDPDDPDGTCKLKVTSRADGALQMCATTYQAQTEQAASCVAEALGSNPYVLVAEEEVQ